MKLLVIIYCIILMMSGCKPSCHAIISIEVPKPITYRCPDKRHIQNVDHPDGGPVVTVCQCRD